MKYIILIGILFLISACTQAPQLTEQQQAFVDEVYEDGALSGQAYVSRFECLADSDGFNILQKGNITFSRGPRNVTVSDLCYGNDKFLREYFCSGGLAAVERVECPNGCMDGKCKVVIQKPKPDLNIINITPTIISSYKYGEEQDFNVSFNWTDSVTNRTSRPVKLTLGLTIFGKNLTTEAVQLDGCGTITRMSIPASYNGVISCGVNTIPQGYHEYISRAVLTIAHENGTLIEERTLQNNILEQKHMINFRN